MRVQERELHENPPPTPLKLGRGERAREGEGRKGGRRDFPRIFTDRP